jgi:rhamnogalacturonyl hydrolase YesR
MLDHNKVDQNTILNSLLMLEEWVSGENYIGWDPYDGINNLWLPQIKLFNPYSQILFIQFNKYSPLNFRKFLSIKKELDTKGLALFIQAYTLMYRKTKKEEFKSKAIKLFKVLMDQSLISIWGNHCWSSHKYPFVGVDKDKLSPHFPDIIGTANALKAITSLHTLSDGKELNDIIASTRLFLKSLCAIKKNIIYFLYTPYSRGKIVPNASAEAIEALSFSLKICFDSEINKICKDVVKSLQELQMQDGSWKYSIYSSGRIYQQLDFHQGYMIDGLISSVPLFSPNECKTIETSILKAKVFYKKMISKEGRCYYRYPKFFPTDIHNQSQGIITFSKLYKSFKEPEDLNTSLNIALWTIKNLQDRKGFFYHQKGKIITNRIPYMRWGQAWMMLALSMLLEFGDHECEDHQN